MAKMVLVSPGRPPMLVYEQDNLTGSIYKSLQVWSPLLQDLPRRSPTSTMSQALPLAEIIAQLQEEWVISRWFRKTLG